MTKRKDVDIGKLVQAIIDFRIEMQLGNYNAPFPYECLEYPHKVTLSVMEKMHKQGVIECGVSLRTGWINWKKLAERYPKIREQWILSCQKSACILRAKALAAPSGFWERGPVVNLRDLKKIFISRYECDICQGHK